MKMEGYIKKRSEKNKVWKSCEFNKKYMTLDYTKATIFFYDAKGNQKDSKSIPYRNIL